MINLTAQVSRTRVIRRAKRPPGERVLEWAPRSHFGAPRAILTVKTQWFCSFADQRGQREARVIKKCDSPEQNTNFCKWSSWLFRSVLRALEEAFRHQCSSDHVWSKAVKSEMCDSLSQNAQFCRSDRQENRRSGKQEVKIERRQRGKQPSGPQRTSAALDHVSPKINQTIRSWISTS